MTKMVERDIFAPDCPIRNILARIGAKWPVLVLYTLSVGEVMRFKALQRELPDISQKMLTVTLRSLEEDGLVIRKVYPEVPPKVEYSLTHRAKTLLPHLNALIGWAKDNMEEIIRDRERKKEAAR